MSDITHILEGLRDDDGIDPEDLPRVIYQELRRIARAKMARERPGNTLQATALVHEAWMSLSRAPSDSWENRAHFFSAAAEAMRRILIASARRKRRQRRGAGAEHVSTAGIEIAAPLPDEQVLALDEALRRFEEFEPRHAELVKLRYFAGLTIAEAAEVLGISPATAKRWWVYAKAWLYHEIGGT